MTVAERLTAVRTRIAAACAACGRDPAEVTLLAVSKTHPADAVRAAHAAGQRRFGENRIQELAGKAAELADLDLTWHAIGPVQTNKVRALVTVPRLELVHSLDRPKLADHLQAVLAEQGRSLQVLLQVNASGEANKHGIAPADAPALLDHVRRACPNLRIAGVMAMGPLHGDPGPTFASAATVRARLADRGGEALPILSLGMTGDLERAIAAGSTLVRIGTAVFGARPTR